MVSICHSCLNCRKYNLFTVRTAGFFQCSCLNIFNLWPRHWGSNLPSDLLSKVIILGHQCTVKKKKKNQSLSNEWNTCSIQWSKSEKQNNGNLKAETRESHHIYEVKISEKIKAQWLHNMNLEKREVSAWK